MAADVWQSGAAGTRFRLHEDILTKDYPNMAAAEADAVLLQQQGAEVIAVQDHGRVQTSYDLAPVFAKLANR